MDISSKMHGTDQTLISLHRSG